MFCEFEILLTQENTNINDTKEDLNFIKEVLLLCLLSGNCIVNSEIVNETV